MAPDLALHLFEEGAFLIFLDVPKNTEFGIDMYSWNVGPKFKGIKMIPPGIHFVYYSAVSKDGQTAPRTGFFHSFKKKEFVVKRWDDYAEDISDEPIPEDELERLTSDVKHLDQFLGAYPYETWKKWLSLTNSITDSVLERMQPLNKKVCSVSQLILDESETMDTNDSQIVKKRVKVKDEEERLLPKMVHKPGTSIRFVDIPDTYPEGSSAAEITRYNLDSSYYLDQLLQNYADDDEILGDLQMAFVCFLVGHVYDAFEYWKSLVQLMCTSDDALAQRPELFKKMIFILYHQIQEIPQDFFIDIVSRQNFLTMTLHTFFMNLQTSSGLDPELVTKGKRFQKYLTKKFKWDFQSEPDDYEPVVVEDVPVF